MALDYNSLLLALGFSAIGLTVTLFCAWLLTRSERFLLTWSTGLVLLAVNIFTFSVYVQNSNAALGAFSMALLVLGLSVIHGAADQFIRERSPWTAIFVAAVPSVILVIVPMAMGYDGVGFLFANISSAVLLLATAVRYWRGRDEAWLPLTGIAFLYALIACSFTLCAVMIVHEGKLVLGHAPRNWAENLNLGISIVGLSCIGALSLSLTQWRQARRHRIEALTDPLTGLLNRRALFEAVGQGPLAPDTAIIVFDIDHFKTVNDSFGHAVGDEVLRRFAKIIELYGRPLDKAARLGGEEFALVVDRVTPDGAVQIADRIRRHFAIEIIATDQGETRCTVSAGVAMAQQAGCHLEKTLSLADNALYLAKQRGRNRVTFPLPTQIAQAL